MLLEKRADRAAVEAAVALGARGPDRRPLAAVEHPELEGGAIRRARHDATERVHLAHHRALGHAANGRIARHLADRLQRARDEGDARAEAGCGHGGFGAGVSRADDDDVDVELGS